MANHRKALSQQCKKKRENNITNIQVGISKENVLVSATDMID